MAALCAAGGVAVALQLPLWSWEVAPAALDFTFARSLAAGDGVVAQVGLERIEGFSNPSWVALIAAATALGADPFSTSRILGLLFGVAAIPLVYLAVRPIAKDPPYGAIAAAAALAAFAPHAIWSQSGLENPWFSLLLAAGVWRASYAGDRDWLGPAVFAVVAVTRPEGVVYGAAAALATAAAARGPYGARSRLVRWALVVGGAALATEIARMVYFAQELPTTYFAKLGPVGLLDPGMRGWSQLGDLARDTGVTALVPLLVFGAAGATGWRGVGAWVVTAVFLLEAAAGAVLPAVVTVAAALPVLAQWRRPPVGLSVALVLTGLAFHLGAGGDALGAYRYVSLFAVPAAVLVGVGVGELSDRIDELRHGPGLALAVGLLPQLLFAFRFSRSPEGSAPAGAERLERAVESFDRLRLDRRPVVADGGVGSQLWTGGDRVWIRDLHGLVDLPFAVFGVDPEVVDHELVERNPGADLVWLDVPGVLDAREVRDRFVEVGGLGIRRDLFLRRDWVGPQTRVGFDGGVALVGLSLGAPEVAPGGGLSVELGLTAGSGAPYRVVVFLTDGSRVRASWELPPGYDWVAPAGWRPEELFTGRFALSVPPGLTVGEYELGVVLLGESGVWPATRAEWPLLLPERPVFARGEVRMPAAVRVVSAEQVARLTLSDRSLALQAASEGRCEDAERSWAQAVAHAPLDRVWQAANRPTVARALAACWAGRAGARSADGDALLDRIDEVERARGWDAREPTQWIVGPELAAVAHRRAVDSDLARVRFLWAEAAVRADPRRSWDRRLAEQARATWIVR
ncbi:MAG: hypothetical protein ABMA64_19940 [Myxococcota bacterium]